MGLRRGRRRRWLLGLTSVAAAGAAALALTPLLAGSGSRVNSQAIGSFLNQAETGVFDHNLAHRASPPAAKRAARAQAAACEDPAQVAADPEACPQDGATSREVAAAEASAAAPAPPALSEASDGLWGPLQQIPSTGDPRRPDADRQGALLLAAQVPHRDRGRRRRHRPRLGPGHGPDEGRAPAGRGLRGPRQRGHHRAGQPLVRRAGPAGRTAACWSSGGNLEYPTPTRARRPAPASRARSGS